MAVSGCDHRYMVDGACQICGQFINTQYSTDIYSDTHNLSYKHNSTFYERLKSYNLPAEVTQKAIAIRERMNLSTHRSGILKEILFYCIYFAYQELEDIQDPTDIINLVGLPTNRMSKALSTCRESLTGYHPKNSYTHPLEILPKYHKELGLPKSTYKSFRNLSERILEMDPTLHEEKPLKIVGSLLKYYCDIHGVTISGNDPLEKISMMVNCSENVISDIVHRIAEIDNS